MTQFLAENSDLIIKLILALFLGGLIGLERFLVHKNAGMKTHALVSMGSALFIIISELLALKYAYGAYDPSRIASQIIVGIGFLGAGSIMLSGPRVVGLTTAGGLWVTAGIGMAVGFGFYNLAIIATVLVLGIFILMSILERPIRDMVEEKIKDKN